MNRHTEWADGGTYEDRVSDRQLLGLFVDQDDGDAFAALVTRYQGLVLGVCRRVLRDEHAAEDAFQATFLVLARRASRVRNRSSLAGWLYAVAYRSALRARQKHQQRREEALREELAEIDDAFAKVARRYEQRLLDEELNRLPARYREPLVLRYFGGRPNQQIATELGISVGVVEGRLKRGKARLRLSLVERGVGLTATVAALGVAGRAAEAATAGSLIVPTARAAAAFRHGLLADPNYFRGAVELAQKELAMSAPGMVTTGSSLVIAVIVAGLALGHAGYGNQQSAAVQIQGVAISRPLEQESPVETVPVSLAAAKGQGRDFESGSQSGVKKASAAEASIVDLWPRSEAETKIAHALGGPTELDFTDAPLSDVLQYLKDYHGIEILLDLRTLNEIGITASTPITMNLKGVSLRTALGLMLRDLDLTYTVFGEVLLITTPEEARRLPVTRIYRVGGLAGKNQAGSGDTDWLVKAIVDRFPTGELPPDSIIAAQVGGQPVLVITNTYRTQEKIEELLANLRQVAESAEDGKTQGVR